MRTYLMGLFVDVQGRTQRMLDELTQRCSPLSPTAAFLAAAPLRAFMDDTLENLRTLAKDTGHIIAERRQLYTDLLVLGSDDAERELAEYDSSYFGIYSRLYERLQRLDYRYTVIIHYGPDSAELGHLLARIYAEIGLSTIAPPVVSLISKAEDYYSANCEDGVIGAPFEEKHHLLNWPDIYHEIAHFIYENHKHFLLGQGQIEQQVRQHFSSQLEQAEASRKGFWRDTQSRWLSYWLMEFTCDLLATYLTGRAYAWSNFRLSSVIPVDGDRKPKRHVYTAYTTHPPNEARMRAIFKMLERCGWHEADLTALKADWMAYIRLSVHEKPVAYEAIIPDDLLELLVGCVFEECPNILLRSYHEQLRHAPIRTPIAHLLDVAWQELLVRPENYPVWEAEQIRQLHATDTPATGA